MNLSVIIPTYQRSESLRRVLLALANQSLPPDRYEVIVSIDGSTDATESMLSQLNVPFSLRWVVGENKGPGAARNRGGALAQSKTILFLDDDIIAGSELLTAHLIHHQAQNRLVCLGQISTLNTQALSGWERYLSRRYDEHYIKLSQPGYHPTFWDCLSGNMSIDRKLFEESGGFSETFGATKHDDIEFAYRISSLASEIFYCPDAFGHHFFAKSVDAGLNDAYIDGLSAQRLAEYYPKLQKHLIRDRRESYTGLSRLVMSWILADERRHEQLCKVCSNLIRKVYLEPLNSRIFHKMAYHLQFWWGVRVEAKSSAVDQI